MATNPLSMPEDQQPEKIMLTPMQILARIILFVLIVPIWFYLFIYTFIIIFEKNIEIFFAHLSLLLLLWGVFFLAPLLAIKKGLK